jgi:hypothetical protein
MKTLKEFRSGSNIKKADKWYKDQPEWGTDAATAKAKKTTPGEDVKEMAMGANTGSIPDSSNTGPMKKKKSIVTKRYLEILGKRVKRQIG